MSGGEADILCPRRFDGRHPLARIEARGLKASSQLGILFIIEVFIGHCPLARSQHRVEPPVQEDAKLSVLKVAARLKIFFRGLIMLCGLRRNGRQR